jgi:hypothetical protein
MNSNIAHKQERFKSSRAERVNHGIIIYTSNILISPQYFAYLQVIDGNIMVLMKYLP